MSYAYRLSLRNGWRSVWEFSENKKRGTFGAQDLRLKLGQLRQNKRSRDMDPFYNQPGRKSIRLESAHEGDGTEDDRFIYDNDIVCEVETLMDRDIDDYLDKLSSINDGPAIKKIREVPSINLYPLDRNKYFVTALERVLHIKSCTYMFECRSCAETHQIDPLSDKFVIVLVSDSIANPKNFDGTVMYGSRGRGHMDVLSVSGRTILKLGKLLLDFYEFERRGLLVYFTGGTSDCLRGSSPEKMIEDVHSIRELLGSLDDKHGRRGLERSRLFLSSLPMCPKHIWLPKEGLATTEDNFFDEIGKTLISFNYLSEMENKKWFPNLSIPRLNNLGHKSHMVVKKLVKKVKGKKIVVKTPTNTRKWEVRTNLWRPSEKPEYIHPSNAGIAKIHAVAKKFLLGVKSKYEKHLVKKPAYSLAITRRSLGLEDCALMDWDEHCEAWSVLSSA